MVKNFYNNNDEYTLNFYFICFIDILGFASMVRSDCENPDRPTRYINKLFKVHKCTKEICSSELNLNIVQFSDSVVLATPFEKDNFYNFVKLVANYQYNLFCENILCRGGIAYGKHFCNNGFMFSNGLIEAYNIEKYISKNPRIVISTDLIELLSVDGKMFNNWPLIKENDGYIFIDYFSCGNLSEINGILNVFYKLKNRSSDIKEKFDWLAQYFNVKYNLNNYVESRFTIINNKTC